MNSAQLQVMIEERGYTFEPPSEAHPRSYRAMQGDTIVAEISSLVLHEIGSPDVQKFLNRIETANATKTPSEPIVLAAHVHRRLP